MENLTKFEAGKNYKMGWIGDSELFSFYKVLSRTAKTVKVQQLRNGQLSGEVKSLRVKEYGGAEYVSPEGVYSMSPVLRADKQI